MPPFWIIPLLPLAGAVVNGLSNRRLAKPVVSTIACGSVGVAFAVAVAALLWLLGQPPTGRSFDVELFTWIASGDLSAPFGFRLDQLSVVMALIVTGVGFLIHVYSVGYMGHDRGYQRYFAYLNLFTSSMLLLVLANNYLLLFVGWELVGLCSYLLIGFWFDRKSAADAGRKAFVVNRIGDFGFLLGLMLLFLTYHGVRFGEVLPHAGAAPAATITAITLLLFVGATGKSAQIPLYVWLPDAMEGPTPVSALIHAATMVTAGVYMVARSAALYVLAPVTLGVVGGIGIATALFAATIALVQTDIKRVLAYSTVSQLGYMFAACGVGAFAAGIFHLMTHAFFKALLFLGAGSVIHGLGGEQDMRRMGGLRRALPWTYRVMLVGTLAIAGVPPLAGFVSKDAILAGAFEAGHRVIWTLGLLTAALTAFYMMRLLILTFLGERRDPHAAEHAHEAPPSMRVPLLVLAVLSITGGWIGLPVMVAGVDRLQRFLAPVFPVAELPRHAETAASTGWLLLLASVGAAAAGLYLAARAYQRGGAVAARVAQRYAGVYRVLAGKWYVDEIYGAVIVRPAAAVAGFFASFFDVWIVDGIVNGVGGLVRGWSGGLRRLQTGQVAVYVGVFLIGVLSVVGFVVLGLR